MLRSHVLLAALALAPLALVRPGDSGPAVGPTHPSGAHHTGAFARQEAARLRAHFRTVLAELEGADVAHLSPARRAARARHVEVLRGYAARGVFPHNHDVAGRRVPYFVDGHGTRCAMAWLIAASGRHDLVEHVASTRNHATIHELADEVELVRWLEEAGLTVEEAARIQPAYDHDPGPAVREEPGISAGYALGSALAGGLGGVSMALNLSGGPGEAPRDRVGVLGVVAGLAGFVLGVDGIDAGGSSAVLGLANAGVGLASAAVGVWGLSRGRVGPPAGGSTSAAGAPASAARAAAPGIAVTATPVVAAGGRAGLVLRARW